MSILSEFDELWAKQEYADLGFLVWKEKLEYSLYEVFEAIDKDILDAVENHVPEAHGWFGPGRVSGLKTAQQKLQQLFPEYWDWYIKNK